MDPLLTEVRAIVAASIDLDTKRLSEAIEARDVEAAVRRGVFEVLAATRSGRAERLWADRTGEALPPETLALAVQRLQAWFGVKA